MGNRTRVLAALGCRVVAVEPHPYLAKYLRGKFAGSRNVSVEENAVSTAAGVVTLYYQPHNLTISSLKLDWLATLTGRTSASTSFREGVTVAAVTLGELIAKHGAPKYLKLDIDGVDPKSLRDSVDQLKSSLGDVVVVLAAVADGKVSLVAGVAGAALKRVKAGELVAQVAAAASTSASASTT